MTKDYKTIRVPADDYDAAKASKHDSETWGEFVQRCTDEPPEVREFVDASGSDVVQLEATEYKQIAEAVAEHLR